MEAFVCKGYFTEHALKHLEKQTINVIMKYDARSTG